MNINEIKNSTLAKLTLSEANTLGLANCGIGLYRGELKTRTQGISRKTNDNITFRFEGKMYTFEFTRLTPESEDEPKTWAARVLENKFNKYLTSPMGIIGCDFIR